MVSSHDRLFLFYVMRFWDISETSAATKYSKGEMNVSCAPQRYKKWHLKCSAATCPSRDSGPHAWLMSHFYRKCLPWKNAENMWDSPNSPNWWIIIINTHSTSRYKILPVPLCLFRKWREATTRFSGLDPSWMSDKYDKIAEDLRLDRFSVCMSANISFLFIYIFL